MPEKTHLNVLACKIGCMVVLLLAVVIVLAVAVIIREVVVYMLTYLEIRGITYVHIWDPVTDSRLNFLSIFSLLILRSCEDLVKGKSQLLILIWYLCLYSSMFSSVTP